MPDRTANLSAGSPAAAATTAARASHTYSVSPERVEGSLAGLPERLQGALEFDSIALTGLPTSKRFTLWFRHGAKRVFHVRLIRTGGRLLVEMGGLDPVRVLSAIHICRDHFDRCLGLGSADIARYECPPAQPHAPAPAPVPAPQAPHVREAR